MSKKEKHSELTALISLLDEPNTEMYRSIREKIASYGKSAIPLLEEAWLDANEPGDVRRIEHLIDNIRFDDLYFELKNWKEFHSDDLIKAFLLMTTFRFPDLDVDRYKLLSDRLRQNIWLEINEDLTALEKVKVLNHIFYEVYKFRGRLPQQINLNDYFLNTLIDTKKGSAIALGILYAGLAQSIDIPIYGVDLHHHFALAYMDDTIDRKRPEDYSEDDVLFYIAVVNQGSVFTKNEIRHYLKQLEIKEKPGFFLPASNTSVINKLIVQVADAYMKEGKEDKAQLLDKLGAALD
ncbi:MAG: transglutaminase family protein [bacterium]